MSSNQKTSIKLCVQGGESKIIPNVLINYLHPNLETFQKHVMTLSRLHPSEPLYDCESIAIKTDEGDKPVDVAVLKEVLSSLSKKAITGSGVKSDKIKLIVSLDFISFFSGKIFISITYLNQVKARLPSTGTTCNAAGRGQSALCQNIKSTKRMQNKPTKPPFSNKENIKGEGGNLNHEELVLSEETATATVHVEVERAGCADIISASELAHKCPSECNDEIRMIPVTTTPQKSSKAVFKSPEGMFSSFTILIKVLYHGIVIVCVYLIVYRSRYVCSDS
jgi:hypothetical protein